ncbi:sulfite exporter TauE/SafE family protein [Caulobacter sp. 17J80-11]|uniref:sulfite exporter TauE/SafE family protein n=1 Tax=Caulobacter sp. 17J80-11 TaxID=2763502 RepID=UPI001653A201|nr:sulfite exporter TauE/SafE family protein [Caulobacter sp. 17J80-11]MBC6980223.1 sulfite exporter TauE/SafE family protein [Caulobacter sp. 17J80-11]
MDLTVWSASATVVSGALVGLLLAVFGGGGSVLATPLLLYFVGVTNPHVAIGTSSAAVAVNALVNLVGHWRGGRVKWPCAAVFGVSGLLGALAGSSLAKQVGGQLLLLFFAVAMAAVAVSMLRKRGDSGDPAVRITPGLAARLAPTGLVVGFAAGFFGIGGGFLIVPGLMAAAGMTLANAAASSLVSVSLFGMSTAANYAASRLVLWPVVGWFLVGGVAGGAAGLKAADALGARAALGRTLFAGLILIVAGYVAWRALSGM